VDPVICRKQTKEALFRNLMMFYTGHHPQGPDHPGNPEEENVL
jgi:hypothetical protein